MKNLIGFMKGVAALVRPLLAKLAMTAVLPLAALLGTGQASAGVAASPPTITLTQSGNSYDYRVVFNGSLVDRIVIPELHAGDLTPVPGGLNNWTFSELNSDPFPFFPWGIVPLAFVSIQAPGPVDAEELTFKFTSPFTTTVEANFYTNAGFVDPPVPNSNVPEPGSLALIGVALAGMYGLQQRRRRTAPQL